MKSMLCLLLVASVLNLECATVGVRYYSEAFASAKNPNQKFKDKKLKILKKDDAKISGYFYKFQNDTLQIRIAGENTRLEKIAMQDIKAIKVYKNSHPEIIVLIVILGVVIVGSSAALASAIEQSGH